MKLMKFREIKRREWSRKHKDWLNKKKEKSNWSKRSRMETMMTMMDQGLSHHKISILRSQVQRSPNLTSSPCNLLMVRATEIRAKAPLKSKVLGSKAAVKVVVI